ncbi:MAG: Gfo/Idh/MocA family oxidoreductase [Microbacteriaceae bacterium]
MVAPLRTGIIGFGLSGRVFHAPFLSTNPDFTLTVIATSDATRRAQAASSYPAADIVGTPQELLARADQLDLIVLASPAHTHLALGEAALQAGAAVVVDKPFGTSVAEAQALIDAAETAKRPLIVFQNRRWDGDFRTVKRLIDEATLGRVLRFESTFERWAGPRRERWQDTMTAAQGAGITFDIGSHLIDQALQLFGPVSQLHAELRVGRPGGVSEDDAFVSLLHESGVRSHLTMSSVAALSGPRFRVLGTKGAYSVDGLDGQESALKAGGSPTDPSYGITEADAWGRLSLEQGAPGHQGPTGQPKPALTTMRLPTERGDYPGFYAAVAAAVREEGPSPVDPREALEVVRIIERIHRDFPIS